MGAGIETVFGYNLGKPVFHRQIKAVIPHDRQAMLVNLNQTLTLAATQEDAWSLLRDTRRLAGLIPGVENIVSDERGVSRSNGAEPQETHVARVVERVGPFRLALDLEVRIVEVVEPSRLQAQLSGADGKGQNRLSGTVRAELQRMGPAQTSLSVDATVEVLGKLATLGAGPIRRRANELFSEFADRLQRQFSQAGEERTP